MSIRFPIAFLSLALVDLIALSGCSPSSPTPETTPVAKPEAGGSADAYNPHDMPITEEQKTQLRQEASEFPKAVAVIEDLRNATETETKSGIPENPYKAHQALDKADLVLQWLPEIARDSGVPKEHWETVNTTANALRTSFEKVHQNIDNKQDPDFASVAGEIDSQIAKLKEIAQTPPAAKGESQP